MNKYALRQTPLTVVIGSVLASGSVAAQASTITVNDTRDETVGTLPGACTLRSAIASANAGAGLDGCDAGSAGADEIVFAPGLANSTITLSEGQIEIAGALTITGPNPDDPSGMTMDGDGNSRLFRIMGSEPGEFEVALHALTLTGGNSTQPGGAVHATDAELVLDHVVVTGNHSLRTGTGSGGGLKVSGGDVTLTNSTISENTTYGSFRSSGGGLSVSSGNATVINSTISGNSASSPNVGYGGGLSVIEGDIVVSNSTISENSATGDFFLNLGRGGGLHVSNGNITLSQSTVAYNTADNTDGIHLTGISSLTLYNSLVVQTDARETACSEAANKHSNSLVTDSSCTGFAAFPAVINLGPLAYNGGATRTHALNPGSAAIDAAGDCVAQFGIIEDQRGAPRPIDGDASGTVECDIGAYEFQDMLFRDRFEQP